jgi:DNA-binding MarR family transcriptional regulator
MQRVEPDQVLARLGSVQRSDRALAKENRALAKERRQQAPTFEAEDAVTPGRKQQAMLSSTQLRALVLIGRHGPITCASLGADLWGSDRRSSNCSCPWARPAGRVIASLRRRGLVDRDAHTMDRFAYVLTSKGRLFHLAPVVVEKKARET